MKTYALLHEAARPALDEAPIEPAPRRPTVGKRTRLMELDDDLDAPGVPGRRTLAMAEAAPLHAAPLQAKMRAVATALGPASLATGAPEALPAWMIAQVGALAGVDVSDVRVYRGSPEPGAIGAEAFARGGDVHLGPGAEAHLGHEVWHVVQQRAGRVTATAPHLGVRLNDDATLEHEADEMGAMLSRRAAPATPRAPAAVHGDREIVQAKFKPGDKLGAYIDEDTGNAYTAWRHVDGGKVIIMRRDSDEFRVRVDAATLEPLDTDPELVAFRRNTASTQPPPESALPLGSDKPQFKLDPAIASSGEPLKKGKVKRLREPESVGPSEGDVTKESPFTAVVAVQPLRAGAVREHREVHAIGDLVIASVSVSDSARGKTKYKNNQKDHTVAWALLRIALAAFAGRPLGDLLGFLQRGVVELSDPAHEDEEESAREHASMLDPTGGFLGAVTGFSIDSSKNEAPIDEAPTGKDKGKDKEKAKGKDKGQDKDTADEPVVPAGERAPVEYWNKFASYLLREYVVAYQQSASATAAGRGKKKREDMGRDNLLEAERRLEADPTVELDAEDITKSANRLLDVTLRIPGKQFAQAVRHWYELLQLAFPRVMRAHGRAVWDSLIASFKPSGAWKRDNDVGGLAELLGEPPDHGYADPVKLPALGLGVKTSLTCHVPVAPTEDGVGQARRTSSMTAPTKDQAPASEHYEMIDLHVGTIQIGEERVETRWGTKDKQRSHTTSFVLEVAAMRAFSNQPLSDLHGYLSHMVRELLEDVANKPDIAAIRARDRAQIGRQASLAKLSSQDALPVSETAPKPAPKLSVEPVFAPSPSSKPAPKPSVEPSAESSGPSAKPAKDPTRKDSARALIAELAAMTRARRPIHEWYQLASQVVQEALRLSQLAESATYVTIRDPSKNESDKPANHGEGPNMHALTGEEEHLIEFGYLAEPPEVVVGRCQQFLDVQLGNTTLSWRGYARAVMHWQQCLWNVFPTVMRAGEHQITADVLKQNMPAGVREVKGWKELPAKVKTVADLLAAHLEAGGGWKPLVAREVALSAEPIAGVGQAMIARETVGRGDAGFNGFALGLIGMVGQKRLAADGVAAILAKSGVPRERFDALVGLHDKAAGARTIQEQLEMPLRHLAVNALRGTAELSKAIFVDLCNEVMRRYESKPRGKLGAVTSAMLDAPVMAGALDEAAATVTAASTESGGKDLVVAMIERWALGPGLDIYFDQLDRPAGLSGGIELDALARVFGVQLLRVIESARGSAVLVSPAKDGAPVLGLTHAEGHWSTLTSPGGAFDLASKVEHASKLDLSLWRHDLGEHEDLPDGDPTLRVEGSFVARLARLTAWETHGDNNCAFNGLGLTLVGLVHQGRLAADRLAEVSHVPRERIEALAARSGEAMRDTDASHEIEHTLAGPLREAAVAALRDNATLRESMFQELLEHLGGRVRAGLGMGDQPAASDLFSHGSPLLAPLQRFSDALTGALRASPAFAAPAPAPLGLGLPAPGGKPPAVSPSAPVLSSLPLPLSAHKPSPPPPSGLMMPPISLGSSAKDSPSLLHALSLAKTLSQSIQLPPPKQLTLPKLPAQTGKDTSFLSLLSSLRPPEGAMDIQPPAWVDLAAQLRDAPAPALPPVPAEGQVQPMTLQERTVDARLAASAGALRAWFTDEGLRLYTDHMRRDQIWAGGPELHALAQALGVHVVTFRDLGGAVHRDDGRGASGTAPVTELLRPHVPVLRVRELIEGGGAELAAHDPRMTFQRVRRADAVERLRGLPEAVSAEFLRLRDAHYVGRDDAPEIGIFRHRARQHWSAVTTERGAFDLRDGGNRLGDAVMPAARVDGGGGAAWETSISGRAAPTGKGSAPAGTSGTMQVKVPFVQTPLSGVATQYARHQFGASRPFDPAQIGGAVGSLGLVNAANENLRGGGGIDGAIHEIAGQDALDKEVADWAKAAGKDPSKPLLGAGEAMTTTGGGAAGVNHIIHTVGPRKGPMGFDLDALRRCCQSVMREAAAAGLQTIVFCNISSGIFGGEENETALAIHAELERLLDQPPSEWGGWKPAKIVFNNFPGKGPSSIAPMVTEKAPKTEEPDDDAGERSGKRVKGDPDVAPDVDPDVRPMDS